MALSPSLEEILNNHLSALQAGRDATETLTAAYGAAYPELPQLLRLGRALMFALVPLAPARAFVADLGAALREDRRWTAADRPRDARPSAGLPLAWRYAAAIGSLLSLLGLLWLRSRRAAGPGGGPASQTA